MTEEQLSGLRRLHLVPERFEFMLGYERGVDVAAVRSLRFVALYWDVEMGQARFDDGLNDGELDWEFWELYFSHPEVTMQTTEMILGGISGEQPTHWLILDMHSRRLYAAPFSQSIEQTMRGETDHG